MKLLHEIPENIVDLLITAINDKRVQKSSGPVLTHYYICVEKPELKKVALSCSTYILKTTLPPFDSFVSKLPDIVKEIKEEHLKDEPTFYLYDLEKYLLPDSGSTNFRIRYAVPPLYTQIETSAGIDKVLKKEGINYILKNFGNIFEVMPNIPLYIKKKYPEFRDKVQLWETLHGIPK